MKTKIKITFILLLISSPELFSQGMFVTMGGGYGFGAAQNLVIATTNSSNYGNGTNTYTYKNVKGSGSFGKGLNFGVAVGHMFTKHIGAELNISYLNGAKIVSSENSTGTNSSSTGLNTATGSMLRFIPSFRLQVGNDKYDIYMRTGLAVGTNCKLTQTAKSDDTYFGTTDSQEWQENYSGGVSFGFSCGVGFIYKFTHVLGVFGEAGIIMQSWSPKKSEYVTYKNNGVDVLPVMSTFEKQKVYVDQYTNTTTSGTQPDNTVPEKILKMYFPFSSAGINFGIRFHLGAKEKETQADTELKELIHTPN